jgi:citrate lyase beta subunit
MIETAKGVQNVDALAAMQEVECLVFGSNDLTKDIKATISPITRHPLLYSMSRTIVAARAENKLVVDGVHMDLAEGSEKGLEQVCVQGKELGFDGKSLIHPKQVEITNRVFSPSQNEYQLACRIIASYGEALSAGKGVCLVDGKLIEQLHVDAAHELINRFKAIERRACN